MSGPQWLRCDLCRRLHRDTRGWGRQCPACFAGSLEELQGRLRRLIARIAYRLRSPERGRRCSDS